MGYWREGNREGGRTGEGKEGRTGEGKEVRERARRLEVEGA